MSVTENTGLVRANQFGVRRIAICDLSAYLANGVIVTLANGAMFQTVPGGTK